LQTLRQKIQTNRKSVYPGPANASL